MTNQEICNLHRGDEVAWVDPDNGECSANLTIQSIRVNGDVVSITHEGGTLECYAEELTLDGAL